MSIEILKIALRIKELRGQMTQKEFADRLDIGRTSVVRYEQGERLPDIDFLIKAYEVYRVEPLWLLTGSAEQLPLTPEEQLLLARFRTSNPHLREAALRVLTGIQTNDKKQDVSGTGNRVAFGDYLEHGDKNRNEPTN